MTNTTRFAALTLTVLLAAPAVRADDDAPRANLELDAPIESRLPPPRYAYAASGVLLLGGLGLGYWAQGEATRAHSLTHAADAADALRTARQSAATSNALYVLAGLSLAYGLVLEFLPEKTAKDADLSFEF
ncbi:MAG: hypothetical protein WBV82_29635 [Myxococcaceae bacterium]